MNTFLQTVAWIAAVIAVIYSFWLLSKKEHIRAFRSFIAASALFIVGIIIQRETSLNLEKIVCWIFAGCFLWLAFKFLENEKEANAFVVFFVAVGCLFAGFSSFQALLRTELIGTFVSSINSYGEKVNDFQTTLARMQGETITNQDKLRSLQDDIVKQQKEAKQKYLEIGNIQKELSTAQKEVVTQSQLNSSVEGQLTSLGKSLEQQMQANSTIQGNLESTEAKLNLQQKQIGTVQDTVAHIFDNVQRVTLAMSSDTNIVSMVPLGKDVVIVGFVLPDMPIQNSIDCWRQPPNAVAIPLLPSEGRGNFFSEIFSGNTNLFKDDVYIFRYVKDTVHTNLWYHTLSTVSNRFFLDGNPFFLPYTNYGSAQ